jgi:hypothetical protein
MKRAVCTLLLAGCVAGCGDLSGRHLQLSLEAQGAAARNVTIRGGSLQLSEARIGLGPLYLCAAQSAEAELCEVALGEWLSAASVDALDDTPQALGTLAAVSGSARSAQLDYGISWTFTQSAPQPSAGAVDGHSVVLRGEAEGDDGSRLRFELTLDLAPVARGAAALQLRIEEHALAQDETLRLTFDPHAWLARVRYADLLALDSDGDGHVAPGPGDQAYEAVAQSLAGSGAPSFSWR